MDYAVFKTGGKQYRVKPGDILDVEKLPGEVDSVAEFGDVLAVSDDGQLTVGSPFVPGASVLAQVQSHYKDRKLIVFKYKAKTRYRRKRGHRQTYTRLLIQDIRVQQATPARRGTRSRATQDAGTEGETGNGS